MFRIRSFATRLAFTYALLTTATVGTALVAGRLVVSHQMIHGVDLLNAAEFEELRDRIEPPSQPSLSPHAMEALQNHAVLDAPIYRFQVCAPDGTVLFRSANLGSARLPPPHAKPGDHTARLKGIGPVRYGEYPLGAVRVQVASSLEQVDKLVEQQDRTLLGLGILVSVLSIGLGYAFSRLVLRPVRTIEQTAARIGAENLSERIPVPAGRDELAELALLLNRTFDRLEGAFTQVRRFTAEASHELKTPLALARLHAEKLARAPLPEEQLAQTHSLLAELQRLQKIIDDLLLLSRTDAGEMPLNRQPQSIHAFITEFAEDAQALAEDRGLRFTIAANQAGAGSAVFDPAWLRRVLLNVLSNALKVSPPGGALTLTSEVGEHHWRVAIADEGPGVPPTEVERIFERFVQLAGRPSGANEGAGLGLAIARSIVLLHGGRIWAENRADRSGLRLVLELPAAPGPA
jgi:signal transduction histidine kinase